MTSGSHSAEKLESELGFDKSQLQKWKASFYALFPSGCVGKDEFRRIYMNYFSFTNYTGLVDKTFSALCTRSGNIDFESFIKALNICVNGSFDKKVELIFDFFDMKKDGYIDADEYGDLLASVCPSLNYVFNLSMYDANDVSLPQSALKPNEILRDFLEVMDPENTGKITLEMFKEACKKRKITSECLNMHANIEIARET